MNLLFVCTGNTCRSAMAEPMMRQRLEKAGLGDEVEVRSAGIAAYAGQQASKGANTALKQRGIDGDAHAATPLDNELISWADLILTMGQSHKRAILERHIEALEKTYTLKEFVDDDPAHQTIFEEMAHVQAEAQTKQALFMAEHADELERLQEKYQEGADEQTENELIALQNKLEESVSAEAARMGELMDRLPSYDIADPYGGSQEVYEATAKELEGLLDKLVVQLKEQM